MMEIWSILLTVTAVLIALYYSLRNNFLEKHGILHTRRLPFVGHLAPVLLERITSQDLLKNMYNINKKAKYVGFYEYETPIVILRDPDLIKSITIKHFDHFVDHRSGFDPEEEPLSARNLVALQGEEWREMRNLLSPAFTSNKMKTKFKLMAEYGEWFALYLDKEVARKAITYDSKNLFTRCTLDLIARCVFGIEVNSLENPGNDFYVLGQKSINSTGIRVLLKVLLHRISPGLMKLLGIHLVDKEIEKFFMELVKDNVKTRDEKGIHVPDMIQLMMEARNKKGKGPTLSIEDMTAQAFLFFLGGFATNSTVMCFLTHHIADDPKVQRKLQEEVDELAEKCGGKLTYEAVNDMPYLDAVINECLRMHPPGTAFDRVCTKDFELPPALAGKDPVLLKVGDFITVPVCALHMDPEYFSDPDKFDPERFIQDPQGTLHSPAYHPFGSGPRICIASRFALLEIKVLIFYLIRKFSFKIGEKMIMPMRIDKSNGLLAEGGFWLTLESRKEQNNIVIQ